jgi:hypothetical protein
MKARATWFSPANRTVGITQKGSWQRIDALGHYAGADYGQYGWTDPVKATIRKREARDLYSPFAKGGNVFCTHNPAVQGAAQFESVHVIPHGCTKLASSRTNAKVCRAVSAIWSSFMRGAYSLSKAA